MEQHVRPQDEKKQDKDKKSESLSGGGDRSAAGGVFGLVDEIPSSRGSVGAREHDNSYGDKPIERHESPRRRTAAGGNLCPIFPQDVATKIEPIPPARRHLAIEDPSRPCYRPNCGVDERDLLPADNLGRGRGRCDNVLAGRNASPPRADDSIGWRGRRLGAGTGGESHQRQDDERANDVPEHGGLLENLNGDGVRRRPDGHVRHGDGVVSLVLPLSRNVGSVEHRRTRRILIRDLDALPAVAGIHANCGIADPRDGDRVPDRNRGRGDRERPSDIDNRRRGGYRRHRLVGAGAEQQDDESNHDGRPNHLPQATLHDSPLS